MPYLRLHPHAPMPKRMRMGRSRSLHRLRRILRTIEGISRGLQSRHGGKSNEIDARGSGMIAKTRAELPGEYTCLQCRVIRNGWTPAEEARLRELYPITNTRELARSFGRSAKAIASRAKILHVAKAIGHWRKGAVGQPRWINRSAASIQKP